MEGEATKSSYLISDMEGEATKSVIWFILLDIWSQYIFITIIIWNN